MTAALKVMAQISLIFILTSCCPSFYWPDPVNNVSDIMNLDPSTTWIRGLRGISDEDIPHLSRITGAEYLDFEGGYLGRLDLTDKGLAKLADVDLPNAKMLDICYCTHITDTGLASVAEMGNIEILGLRACYGITDAGMKHLAKMRNLKYLDIQGCPQITNEGLSYLSQSKSLERLYLGRLILQRYAGMFFECAYWRPFTESPSTAKMEEINGLNLKLGNQISNEGIKYLANLRSLKCLHLHGLDSIQIDNRCLQYLLEMPNLEEISFYGTPFLDTNSMTQLAKFKNLKNLMFSVEDSSLLTDASFEALSQSCTIEKLTIYVNDNITFAEISHLSSMKTLKELNIKYIKEKPRKQLKMFHKVLPSCAVTCTNEKGIYWYEYTPPANR